ncbi:acetyl-CoA synthetase-like protein [Saccharata proteae CBS 121410]|uniref:Acetyl-CoA synthetase-like protein n=1 Tax=Saccharata proteae CBS 121410 TaxID=1314787 RepID=A0A9P4HXZ0_9PEZI|nr:acetyl-CoA synthetase-like protein [Saccharata proteae CBS 121410]
MGSIAGIPTSSPGYSPFADKPLPRRVDEIASHDPNRTWVTVPLSDDVTGPWRDINFKEFSTAVSGAARWIENTIGLGRCRDPVAYLGINDIRYAVLVLALMKTNRKALLLSLRNSDEGQINLMRHTECTNYFYSEGVDKQLKVFSQYPDAKGFLVPTLEAMIEEGSHGIYESHGGEGEREQVLVLHTSGSTGLPKPIYITNAWFASFDHQNYLSPPPGRENSIAAFLAEGKSMFTMSPFFHTLGFVTILRSIYAGPLVLPPVSRPANVDLACEVMCLKKAPIGLFAPSMLEEISETQRGLDAISNLDIVYYAGAPLGKQAGDRINEVCDVNSIIGSTEACFIPTIRPPKEDWQYFEWSPWSGVVMEPAGDGLYEQVIKPMPNVWPSYLGVFYTFPDIKEWRTKDLWEPHPTKPILWRYRGRCDDVIVFNNGEKFNPVSFEKTVDGHPLVKGALVVGQDRFQPALLIEPNWEKLGGESLHYLLNEVWSAVEEANAEAPAYSQVWKNKIAFTPREKPFSRAGKGSIQRRATLKLFEAEIDALYLTEGFDIGTFDKDFDLLAARTFLHKAFALTIPAFKGDVNDNTDIFDLGADSLQVMALSSALSQAIKSDGSRDAAVVLRDIYAHPTVDKLAIFLLSRFSTSEAAAKLEVPREQLMAEMVSRYTTDLPHLRIHAEPLPPQQTVILTGSTGSLGNYILEELITSPNVAKVYCLNRSDSAEVRQAASFTERDVSPDFSKVSFLRTDFSKTHFDLPLDVYEQLASTVTTFIHNAWAVDFNKALESYETTHISGVRRVVDFSLSSKHRAHIFFISSIASVGNWPNITQDGRIPEEFIGNDSAPLPQGYGESKHVASRILAIAAEQSGVPATILRAGQLAGPRQEKGVWNRHEWLPSLVHTSKNMGLIPANLGSGDIVDWAPMDAAARTVVEVAETRLRHHQKLLDVFHIANPHVSSWRALVPVIQAFYKDTAGVELRAVEFAQWLKELKAVPLTNKAEVEAKPGIKLVDFYEGFGVEGGGLPHMDTERTAEVSACLAGLGPVDGPLFENWLRQWQF